MVGTVEPRKGHRQTLAAFERLWSEGVEASLVICGKQGWMMDDFAEKVTAHEQTGRLLFWYPHVSDQHLQRLYQSCTALLMASEGEGFGLPIIEAARHGLPVIARDLKVFREVAGSHAAYFWGLTAEELSASLLHWLNLQKAGQVPASRQIPIVTWKESAREVLSLLISGSKPGIKNHS